MTGYRHITKFHDLLDGQLSISDAEELRVALEANPALEREFRQITAVHVLLGESLDIEPPPGFGADILAAVDADRQRRARIFRLPSWAENSLVLAGAAALAGFVAFGRQAGSQVAVPWLGKLGVSAVDAVGVAKSVAVGTQGTLAQLDWLARLAGTLGGAGWKALGTSADVLVVYALVSLVLTSAMGFVFARKGRGLKGGIGHAHMF